MRWLRAKKVEGLRVRVGFERVGPDQLGRTATHNPRNVGHFSTDPQSTPEQNKGGRVLACLT